MRAACLKINNPHDAVQRQTMKSFNIRKGQEEAVLNDTRTKFSTDQHNMNRSGHHFVSLF